MTVIGRNGQPLRYYEATVADILKCVEEHGREISLTKLQIACQKIANEHHFKFVDWKMLKMVVNGMVANGMLKARPTLQGFYRYDLSSREQQ